MNEQGSFAAALLDASRKAYAAGAVLRLREAGEDGAGLVRTLGFDELVEDTQGRVRSLAEALACGRKELFALDVDWLASVHAARGVPPALLPTVLDALAAELEESLPPDVAKTAGEIVRAARDQLRHPREAPASLLANGRPHVDLARGFLHAVLEGDRVKAEKLVLDAHGDGVGVGDLHRHVIAAAQDEMGRMWQMSEVHVAEEHMGSRIVEDVLALLHERMPRKAPNGLAVLTASVPGNLHDIGARIVADQFEMNGWRSIFLGANVPVADLVRAVRDFEPDLVALSVGIALHVRAAAEAIAALRAEFASKPILVGGLPFALVEGLWKDVGADGCAPDAAAAVQAGADLVASA